MLNQIKLIILFSILIVTTFISFQPISQSNAQSYQDIIELETSISSISFSLFYISEYRSDVKVFIEYSTNNPTNQIINTNTPNVDGKLFFVNITSSIGFSFKNPNPGIWSAIGNYQFDPGIIERNMTVILLFERDFFLTNITNSNFIPSAKYRFEIRELLIQNVPEDQIHGVEIDFTNYHYPENETELVFNFNSKKTIETENTDLDTITTQFSNSLDPSVSEEIPVEESIIFSVVSVALFFVLGAALANVIRK